jgi:lysophospholipase L1-like esterase
MNDLPFPAPSRRIRFPSGLFVLLLGLGVGPGAHAAAATATPAPAPFRILFIGDSITRHGIKPSLKWDHVAGMAASNESKDYAHRLGDLIQGTMPDRKVEVEFPVKAPNEAALIAQYGNSTAAEKAHLVGASASLHPDLVVVQLGEHETKEKGAEALRAGYDQLLSILESWLPRPKILCTGVWCPLPPFKNAPETYYGWTATINDTMKAVCARHHVPFVDVQNIAMNPACHGTGEVKGVQWHPNDEGHAEYAARLFAAFEKNSAQ